MEGDDRFWISEFAGEELETEKLAVKYPKEFMRYHTTEQNTNPNHYPIWFRPLLPFQKHQIFGDLPPVLFQEFQIAENISQNGYPSQSETNSKFEF